jgi:sugar transferase (PEP-CTERM/EpsH1 system associated)
LGGPFDILVLSHLVPWPTTSGVLLRCYNLLREVARRHRLHLYAFNQEVLLPAAEVGESIQHLEEFCAEVRVFPIPSARSRLSYAGLLSANLLSPLPYSVPRFYSRELEQAVIELLSKQPIRVLQFETIAMAQYAALAPDLPTILVHQNVESQLLQRRAAREANPLAHSYIAGQARKLAAYEARICPQLDANVAVSESDRSEFEARIPGAQFEVVVNGVDVDYFRPPAEPAAGGVGLIFVGGMSWYPNRDAMSWFLHEVWPRVRRAQPAAYLVVVGSHPSPEVQRAARRGDRVYPIGLVDDIRPEVQRAAVYVCPMRVGGGTRLKILDAWAMGKAVVSTTMGAEGLGAVAGRDLEIADEPAEFADKVVALLGDATRRRRLGSAGRARAVEEYAWPKVAAGMLGLYAELVARHAELSPVAGVAERIG